MEVVVSLRENCTGAIAQLCIAAWIAAMGSLLPERFGSISRGSSFNTYRTWRCESGQRSNAQSPSNWDRLSTNAEAGGAAVRASARIARRIHRLIGAPWL